MVSFSASRSAPSGFPWIAVLALAALASSSVAQPGLAVWDGPPLPTDQPFASAWFPETLLEWDASSDPDAPYNRAAVPLRPRVEVREIQANPNARAGEAGVNPLPAFAPTNNNPAQGHDAFAHYAFGYWPYVDLLVYWGGSAAEGIILPPTPGVTDAAHRHGVPVLGTVFFPPIVYGGNIEWVYQFVRRDGDRFPVADKLIEVAEAYGFEGWFINQETEGGDPELARQMQDLLRYIQQTSDLRIEWYDAMNESGEVRWQDAFNTHNDGFFQQGAERLSDDLFIDFGWSRQALRESRAHALALGRDPYRLYAGADVQRYGLRIARVVAQAFPEGEPHLTSLGLYRPDITDPAPARFMAREQALWVGPDGDPSRSDDGAWNGIAHYIPAVTSIHQLPFWTDFNPGHGFRFFRAGENVAPARWAETGWNNLSLQSLQPTWRWWVETDGTPLKVSYDFRTAYEGTASLRLQGDASAEQTVHLFKMRLDLTTETVLDLALHSLRRAAAPLDIALRFADAPEATERVAFGSASAGWTRRALPLRAFSGRELIGLSLVTPASDEPTDLRIGLVGVVEPLEAPRPPSAIVSERVVREPDRTRTSRLRWTASPDPVLRYEVAARQLDGSVTVLGGTSGTALFVSGIPDGARLEVVAMGPTGERSSPVQM